MKRSVIIVAAGSGTRMGGELPKQYLKLQGKPLIIHAIERFYRFDPEMQFVLVLSPAHHELWEEVAASYAIARGLTQVKGGATRYDSVRNGLTRVDPQTLVGIHDAARPLVSQETLLRCYEAAQQKGSGIPVVDMDDSVRMVDPSGGSVHMDRTSLKRVQTPQVFRSGEIKKAYEQPFNSTFTDDASVYENMYGAVQLVEGNRENIKITTPGDLLLAGMLIAAPE